MSPARLRSSSIRVSTRQPHEKKQSVWSPKLISLRNARGKPCKHYSFKEACSSDTEPYQSKRHYGSEDQSWYPNPDDENAPSLFQDEECNFLKPMNRGNNSTSTAPKKKSKKGKKDSEGKVGGSRTRRGKGLNFDKVFYDQDNVKMAEESEEICIIDRDAYIKGTQEGPTVLTTKSHDNPSKELSSEGSEVSGNPQAENQEAEKDRQNEIQGIQAEKANLENGCDVMPQNYCSANPKPEANASHSLSSLLSQSKVEHEAQQNEKRQRQLVTSPDPTRQTHENILNMLNLQDPDEKEKGIDPEEEVYVFKRPPPPSFHLQSPGSKKRMISSYQGQREHIEVQMVEIKAAPTQIVEKEIDYHKESACEEKISNNEKEKSLSFIPQQLMNQTGLKERIQAQLQHLLVSEPINLQEEDQEVALPSHQCSPNDLRQSPLQAPHQANIQPGHVSTSDVLCSHCTKLSESQKRFVEFLRAEVSQMNKNSSDICLDQIYCEQETFILVNGWNPHIEGDRIRKLVSIQNQNYLQSMFLKREVRGGEVDSVLANQRLAKIVGVGGNWFGVFRRVEDTGNRYSYVRMGTVADRYKQEIVEYLTSLE